MEPVRKDFSSRLMTKNVAHDFAIAISNSVWEILLEQKTAKFTSVMKTVGIASIKLI